MSAPAIPAATATPVTTPAQQIIDTPQQLVKKIDELAQKIKDARIAKKLFYLALPFAAVVLPLSFLATPVCLLMGLGVVPTAIAIIALVVSLIAAKYAFTYAFSDSKTKCITNLEGQLAQYFNQVFSVDHGKLTPEHLQLLQKYAPLLDKPTNAPFTQNFKAGIERDKAFELLTAAVKNEAVKQVIRDTAKEFDANELIPLDAVSSLQFDCKFNDDMHTSYEEAIKKGERLKKGDGSPYTLQENQDLLKKGIVGRIKVYRDTTDVCVNLSDVAQVIKAMINVKELWLKVATKEIFEALKDLNVEELNLLDGGAYSVTDVTHLPSKLKKLCWSNNKDEVKDIRPLAARCPNLTKLEIRRVHSDAISGFSAFSNLKSLAIMSIYSKELTKAHGEAILTALPKLDYLSVDAYTLTDHKKPFFILV